MIEKPNTDLPIVHSECVQRDRFRGVEVWFHWHDDETVTVQEIQDVETTLEINRAMMAQTDERSTWNDGVGERVASVPLVLIDHWAAQGIDWFTDKAFQKRILNDRDWSKLRTRPGKI